MKSKKALVAKANVGMGLNGIRHQTNEKGQRKLN
jgi:hypothetical protein